MEALPLREDKHPPGTKRRRVDRSTGAREPRRKRDMQCGRVDAAVDREEDSGKPCAGYFLEVQVQPWQRSVGFPAAFQSTVGIDTNVVHGCALQAVYCNCCVENTQKRTQMMFK